MRDISRSSKFQVRTLTHDLHGRRSKIDLYEVNKYAASLQDQEHEMNKEINMLETILSTRMTQEETKGVISYLRALLPSATVSEIEEGLVSFVNILNIFD